MNWINIEEHFPPTSLIKVNHETGESYEADLVILALYKPFVNGKRSADFSECHYDSDAVVILSHYAGCYPPPYGDTWFIPNNRDNIRFTKDDIKKYIGWWSYLPELYQPERLSEKTSKDDAIV